MNEDVTFFDKRDCPLKKCSRHAEHIKAFWFDHSFAALEDTEYCEKMKDKGETVNENH